MAVKFYNCNILDAKKLIASNDELNQDDFQYKKLNRKQDKVLVFKKKSFDKYNETQETRVLGRIRKRQLKYKDYEDYNELVEKKHKKKIIGKATLDIDEENDKHKYYDIKKSGNRHIYGYAWIGEENFLEITTFNLLWLLIPIIIGLIIAFMLSSCPKDSPISNPFDIADGNSITDNTTTTQQQEQPLCYFYPYAETTTLTKDSKTIPLRNVTENKDTYYISYNVYIDGEPILDANGDMYDTKAITPGEQINLDLWSKLDKGTYKLTCKATEWGYKEKDKKLVTYDLTTNLVVDK